MPTDYGARLFAQDEAARISGLHPGTLRSWIHDWAALFVSERVEGRRMFSMQDILTLRVAHALTLGGMQTLTALAAAHERCRTMPPRDAMLVVPSGAISANLVVLAGDDPPADPAFQVLRFGRMAAEVAAACAGANI